VDLLRVASRSCGKPNLGLPDFRPGSLNSRKYFPASGSKKRDQVEEAFIEERNQNELELYAGRKQVQQTDLANSLMETQPDAGSGYLNVRNQRVCRTGRASGKSTDVPPQWVD
jgi:hypothetical protein